MLKKNLHEAFLSCTILIQEKINELLPQDFSDSKLVEAMRYSSLSDGKRIRPFLLMTSAQIFGINPVDSLNAAAALEFVHVYSLIHDDLPAMDDDDFRRGRPSCHKQFDEATAILAGDSLLTYAFEIIASSSHRDPLVRCELVKTLAKAAGFMGMAGGQMIDLEKANRKISKEELAKLHRLKTGELFMASAEMGSILGHADTKSRSALRNYAHDLGLAFQIRDDILDHCGVDGGRFGIDEVVHKKPKENASIVDVVGMENAQKQLVLLEEQAIAHLKSFGSKAEILVALAGFVTSRKR